MLYIDGALHMPGDPLLNDPTVRQAIERSKAGAKQEPTKPRHKSLFSFDDRDFGTQVFADGGLVGHYAGSGSIGRLIAGFADGGSVDFDPVRDLSSPLSERRPSFSADDVSSAPAGASGKHFGTVDLTTDHGTYPVMGDEEVLEKMTRASQKRAIRRTGISPSWQGGT
ncbi:hypothetical protein [Bradyrhizobium macuxiense]|uniref:hypothetical protein n=1 Tax=Bradyrhizobium macuxiense TaxID=1755647 RepID=UPI000ACB8F36|nr:hypothetical protein [Bradyrhizobium macuxiense]